MRALWKLRWRRRVFGWLRDYEVWALCRLADDMGPGRSTRGAGGHPYDGHTLATVIPETEAQIGASLARIVADRGYRGHNAPPDHRMKVYISGQKRGLTEAIKRDLRRRSAVEPVIGHAKSEHRMGRNFLKGTHGDAANAVLAAAGYNFRRLLA